jgi:ribonuclease-3
MKDFLGFEKHVGIHFNDKGLLKTAFTHRSFINESKGKSKEHNERLEFLGDAVLELIVTDFLFAKFPQKPEGELTAFRAALVNTTTLSAVATGLGIGDYLILSKGEAKDTGRARQYILANAMEALIGALYLDKGYDTARDFITKHILILIDDIVENKLWQDAKSRLQEVAQDKLSVTPSYEVLDYVGPDHDRTFTVGVFIGKEKIAEGSGNAKQEAEQDAAYNALESKGWK